MNDAVRVFHGENQGKTPGKPTENQGENKDHKEAAKKYLKRAYFLDLRIQSKERQLQAARDMATKATSTMSATRVSGTAARSKVEEYGSKAVDLEAAIKDSARQLIQTRYEIMQTIEKVQDECRRTVLELRHLDMLEWLEIETALSYSHRQAMRIYGNALLDVAAILEKMAHNGTSKCDTV